MAKDIRLNKKNQARLVEKSTEIALEDAKKEQSLNYIIKLFSQSYLPYKKTDAQKIVRRNGKFELQITANDDVLPYGSIPRLMIAWIITEVVQKKSKKVVLGNNMRKFIKEIGLDTTGRKYKQVREQLHALFTTTFRMSFLDENDEYIQELNKIFPIVSESKLWWNKKNHDVLFESEITISNDFYELCQSAIPIDKRALSYLKKAPLALDIYFWLSHRFYFLKRPSYISWEQLKGQFGSEYKNDKRGRQRFRNNFKQTFAELKTLYPQINYEFSEKGLELRPSRLFIKKIENKNNLTI